MTNVTVHGALISAIELIQCFEAKLTNSQTAHGLPSEKVKRKLRDVISEIDKFEPVYMRYNEKYGTWSNIGEREYKTEIEGKHRGKILYSFPPINSNSNQEQIAIRERDRLGFAVVNVIGKLDEIIENTQEVEVDDFLHIAVPVDMWNELQAELEYMPKRADLYTSPQPIEKCEPVGELILDPVFLPALKAPLVNWKINLVDLEVGTKFYTSPQPREWDK